MGQDSILIIGAGNMGRALARGIRRAEAGRDLEVRVHDIHQSRLKDLLGEVDVVALPELPGGPLADRAVVLCVKPQDLATVSQTLAPLLSQEIMVVSILAGVSTREVGQTLGFRGAVVRAMPNIAATVGAAATAMCENGACTQEQMKLAEKIFSCVGQVDWIKESLLNAVTGLSGSGPAYLYMIIEALTEGGIKMGIPHGVAARLASQTVLGSAMLVQESGLHPAILKDQVTTPGGTTINAVHELEERGLRAMLISAVETATLHSAKLGQQRNTRASSDDGD